MPSIRRRRRRPTQQRPLQAQPWSRPACHWLPSIARVWHALCFSRCSLRTCVRVRLEALPLLLAKGYWASDVLTVHDVSVRACAEQLRGVCAPGLCL